MTDEELVKRLRSWDGSPFDDDAHEAADRIEELEAKLAKAAEALGEPDLDGHYFGLYGSC